MMSSLVSKFIVTTTINSPTEAIKKFDQMQGWHLIVIGDQKTPKDFKLQRGTYVSPDQQTSLGFKSVSHIPWNVIQRRNIGYLLALKEGADVIATVDDDNIPYDKWGNFLPSFVELCTKDSFLVVDPLYEYEKTLREFASSHALKIWHRGFPLQLLGDRSSERYTGKNHVTVDVVAGLWDGDPDVDAVCRISHGPFNLLLPDNIEFSVAPGTFSPFNTQNTLFSKRVAPCMCLPYDIGRMDDIWASYMTEKVMHDVLGSQVAYTQPTVYQDRNEHDLTIDLEREVLGYRHTLTFLNALKEIELPKSSVLEAYASLVEQIAELPFISKEMTSFQRAWISDVEKLV